MSDFESGIPDITVIIRENKDTNLINLDIPDISVVLQRGDDYSVNIAPNSTIISKTGSFSSYADFAGTTISASYATTASYTENAVSVPEGTVSSSAQVVTYVSGSTIVPNRVASNEYTLIAGAVSLTFTGSITSGIFGATEYVLPFIPTSSYSAATVEYVASRQGGLRVGVILAGWSGSNTTVTDISSTDVGDTSDIRFTLVQDSGYIKLRVESIGSGSYSWTVQSLFKLFPTLM